LPEYAARTGQACAVCHVNPAGGGPRTVRGLLWVAQGKPDQVPPLPGSAAEEPAATMSDGVEMAGERSSTIIPLPLEIVGAVQEALAARSLGGSR
jgi:hypothetical protein